jgi:hypothetical protein
MDAYNNNISYNNSQNQEHNQTNLPNQINQQSYRMQQQYNRVFQSLPNPPHIYSPQYAAYVGAKSRAQASVRIGLGGAY